MKRIAALIICAFVVMFACIPVSAHPGRTDSAGGHRDHSTGEYHYHHGRAAHAHYRIDNDWFSDCPDDFRITRDDSGKIVSYERISNNYKADNSDFYGTIFVISFFGILAAPYIFEDIVWRIQSLIEIIRKKRK